MGEAIGQSLPLAIGVALSPVSIIAVVGRAVPAAPVSERGAPLGWSRRRWEEVPLPAWMGAIDKLKPAAALGGGVLLGGVRPKSFLLVVGAAAAIAQTGIAGGQQAIAYAVFAILATIGVGAPVVIYFAMGTRSGELPGRLKGWMRRHNAVILAVVLLVIGGTLIGDGIGGLTS